MPPSAEHCRAKASECAELAATTQDSLSKRILEQTTQQWYALADGAENHAGRGSRQLQLLEAPR
jgi:hypothetical protein